jgi:hypothetical protein
MKKNKIKQKGYDEKHLPIFQFFDKKYVEYDIDEIYYQCLNDDYYPYSYSYSDSYEYEYSDSDSDSDISHLYEYYDFYN